MLYHILDKRDHLYHCFWWGSLGWNTGFCSVTQQFVSN